MSDLRSVAVTGAAGFLGSHLVAGLRARSIRVLPIVREIDARSPEGSRSLTSVLRDPRALDGLDALIHSAAIRHRHGAKPQEYYASNVDMVRGLLDACASRVRRFVFVSSVGVYGFPSVLPITEAFPFAPRTLYSQTKVEAERLVRELATAQALDFTIVRPTIFYGPNDDGMLPKLAKMIRAGRYLIVGDGRNTLHHAHVDDIVEGIRLAALLPAAAGEDMILAGPETITLEALSRLVASVVGAEVPRVHVPAWLARAVATGVEVARYRDFAFAQHELPVQHDKLDVMTLPIAFDISKATRLLGFAPRVAYAEGIARTLIS
jgi:nucleoside-diphosphate-sugar epimerase